MYDVRTEISDFYFSLNARNVCLLTAVENHILYVRFITQYMFCLRYLHMSLNLICNYFTYILIDTKLINIPHITLH
jgi:hypothetical protein